SGMKTKALIAVAAAALIVPAVVGARPSRGVVVKIDRSSHLVAIAGADGIVQLAHVPNLRSLQVGQRVSLALRALHNGTVAASSLGILGRAGVTHVRGVVLVRGVNGLVLSGHGALLTLHVRTARTLSARGPQVGSVVDATVKSSATGLQATHLSVVGTAADT